MKTLNKKSSIYLESVIIEPCEEGGYFAKYPLLQGCYAEGETYGEVIDNIISVIESHIDIRNKEYSKYSKLNKSKSIPTFAISVPVLA